MIYDVIYLMVTLFLSLSLVKHFKLKTKNTKKTTWMWETYKQLWKIPAMDVTAIIHPSVIC